MSATLYPAFCSTIPNIVPKPGGGDITPSGPLTVLRDKIDRFFDADKMFSTPYGTDLLPAFPPTPNGRVVFAPKFPLSGKSRSFDRASTLKGGVGRASLEEPRNKARIQFIYSGNKTSIE